MGNGAWCFLQIDFFIGDRTTKGVAQGASQTRLSSGVGAALAVHDLTRGAVCAVGANATV
eukprot:COSAG02_NODE_62046_length_267_cov_0.601190_1_plen_59_part_01